MEFDNSERLRSMELCFSCFWNLVEGEENFHLPFVFCQQRQTRKKQEEVILLSLSACWKPPCSAPPKSRLAWPPQRRCWRIPPRCMGTRKQEEEWKFCQYPFWFNIAHRHQLVPNKCKEKKKVIFLSLLKSIWLSFGCFHLDKRKCSENVHHYKNDGCITIIHFSSKHFTKRRALQA